MRIKNLSGTLAAPWGVLLHGEVGLVPDAVGEDLIRRGLVENLEPPRLDPKPTPEVAPVPPQVTDVDVERAVVAAPETAISPADKSRNRKGWRK